MNAKDKQQIKKSTVVSADGSVIGYDRSGHGPPVILIAQALADRRDHRRLAKLLSASHTVINYDRRGRGTSTENSDWTVDREIDDITALINTCPEPVALFGASSGAVLAMEAASALQDKVRKVVAFEAPVIVDNGRAPIRRDFPDHLRQLVHTGRRSQAVHEFMTVALGVPPAAVLALRCVIPLWRPMTAMAQTAAYDLDLCSGLQDGTPIPADPWSDITADVQVLVGEKSAPWMHTGAQAVAHQVGGALVTIPDAHHATPTTQPRTIVPTLLEFFATSPGNAPGRRT